MIYDKHEQAFTLNDDEPNFDLWAFLSDKALRGLQCEADVIEWSCRIAGKNLQEKNVYVLAAERNYEQRICS